MCPQAAYPPAIAFPWSKSKPHLPLCDHFSRGKHLGPPTLQSTNLALLNHYIASPPQLLDAPHVHGLPSKSSEPLHSRTTSPGNISPNSSDDFTKYLLDILFFPPLHDDPYIQAYDAIPSSQVIIALPAIIPPPMFDSRDFFSPKNISSPKDTEIPIKSTTQVSLSSSIESSSPVR
ncbi:hypothetical protein Tco_0527908 [Tanacetum coccineum]